MYNVVAITTALRGLVGFRQYTDEDIEPLETSLNTSRSGLYVDGAHALLTAQVLNGAALVRTPEEDPGDTLSAFIQQRLDDSVGAVLIALRTRKLLRLEGISILPRTALYEGEGSISDLIQPAGRFVGLRLIVSDPEIAVTIPSIGLQFTGPVTGLPISVYGNPNSAAIATATVTTTYSGRMYWAELSTPFVLSGYNSYIIGYDESDLPSGVSAVRRAKYIGYQSCSGCSPENSTLSKRWGPYFSVEGVRIDNPGDPVDVMPDQNYGINLAFSIGCDITNLVISQQIQLAAAIQQQCVVKLLNELAFTPLITTLEQQVKQNAMFALKNGEEAKLERLIDALDIDLSGLSANCLPDTNAGKMPKRGTVFNRR